MEVLSAVVSGVVTKLVEYAVAPVGRQVGYVIQYNSNLKNLMTKVQILKDRRQRISDVNKLTKEVDEVTREVDTFLGSEGHAKAKCFHGFCPNPILYYQLSKKSKKFLQKIEPFENAKFPPPEICSVPSQDYLAFDSRISVVKEIMKELRNPADTNKIGVWGVGGVGKTTLAKEVYRQANEEKLFDGVAIIVDVKNYSGPERIPTEKYTERIQKEIAEKLDIDVRDCLTEKGRARHLWDELKEKKILVILDDVWERIEMEEVGIPPTCNVLFTSRSRDRLYSEMGIQKDFGLDTLGEEESWSLFEKMAGGVVREEPIRAKAILVSKKCEGLPILVVTVARALSNCSTLHEWKDALRRLKKLDLKSSEEKPLLTLEWSYNQLDTEELKSLFLVCGILASSKWNNFINLEDCFKYSMGLGLLQNTDTMEEARDAFHSMIKKLQNYSLLLEHLGGSKNVVRMHELLRNVGFRIARRDKHALLGAVDEEFRAWPNKEFFRKSTMICLRQSKVPKLPQVPWECSELKLLYLDFGDVASVAVPDNLFEDMKKLQVLDLSALHIPSLSPSLQFLTNLQTLCLDRCVLEDIALVGQLRNLEILSFGKSKIKQLPEEIGQLTRLRLLDLTGCSELVLIPPNVLSILVNLEDLRMGEESFRQWEAEGHVGSNRTNASLSELTQLSKLTALEIHIRDASVLPSGLFLHLERYHVLIGEDWEWLRIDDGFNTLKLKLATSKQVDRGLEMLVKKSEHLYLDVMEGVSDIFHQLNSDQQLKDLHVENSGELTYLINHKVFQKLQSSTLKNLPKLVTLSSEGGRAGVTTQTDEQFQNEIECPSQIFDNGEGIELVAPATFFTNLTTLEVIRCQRLEYLMSSSISQSLMQLTRLVVRDCKSLTEIVGSSSEDEAGNEIAFNRSKHLELFGLPSLQCFFLGNCNSQTVVSSQNEERKSVATVVPCFLFNEKVGFRSLETLIIEDVPKLLTIWHEQLAPDSFCKLRRVDVQRCQSLITIFGAGIMGRLNALISLKLTQCQTLQLVFEQEGFTAKETVDASITLEYCQNLGSVYIESCESLRNIFPASVAKGLPQLRELRVNKCDRVEEIVAMEGVGMTSPTFVFPNATHVEFYMLPQIKCFYNGIHTSKWPLLKELSVNRCENVEIFVSEFSRVQSNLRFTPFLIIEKDSLPNLEVLILCGTKLEICDGPLSTEMFRKLKDLGFFSLRFKSMAAFSQNFLNLEKLDLVGVPLEDIFVNHGGNDSDEEIHAVGTQLPRLMSLKLREMSMLMHLGKENSQPVVIPKLEILEVEHCVKLQSLMSSALSFQYLTTLKVTGCHGLQYLMTCAIAQRLLHLTHLEVKDCQNLIEIVGGNQDDAGNEIAFTRLQHLELSALPSFRRLCCGNHTVKLTSLDTLVVTDCFVKLRISPDGVLLNGSNPEWLVQSFYNLNKLVLHGDHNSEMFIHEGNKGGERRAVWTLPSLKSLQLLEMPMLMKFEMENSLHPIIPNLEILEVTLCDKLKNVSATGSFKYLTTLKVIGCKAMEYLITISIAQSLTRLRHLEVKDCESLKEIVGSSSEDEVGNTIAFNWLQHLELSGLPSLQCFFSGNRISQTRICNEIEERCLGTDVQYFLFHKEVGFPSLETLIIKDLPQLLTIWHEQLAPDSFCKLRTVDVQRCQSLITIFGAGIMGRLNALVSLKLTQCQSLQLVFEQEGLTAKERDDASITLEYCPNLDSVNIESCESLRNIFPASVAKGLPQLRELKVKKCDRVEEIVAMEGVGMTSPTFVFRYATSVEFAFLPQLASFYPGMHTSVWPLLEHLTVFACENVEIFALEFSRLQTPPESDLVGTRPLFLIQKGSFYNLKSLLLLSRVGNMKNWWSLLPAELFSKLKTLGSHSGVFHSGFLQKLPHLEELRLIGFEKEVFVHQGDSTGEIQAVGRPLPHLKSLTLNMPGLMDLGKENYPPVFPNLEILLLIFCRKLKNLKSSAISYQNLQTLEVTDCDELEYLITCSMAQSLTQLTSLEVKDCRGLMEIVADSNHEDDAVKEIAFMKLETLKLSGLPSLQSFCSGNCIVKLPSLGTLTVTNCLIELKFSPEKLLLSNSKPERLELIEEEAKDHDKPEGSGTA